MSAWSINWSRRVVQSSPLRRLSTSRRYSSPSAFTKPSIDSTIWVSEHPGNISQPRDLAGVGVYPVLLREHRPDLHRGLRRRRQRHSRHRVRLYKVGWHRRNLAGPGHAQLLNTVLNLLPDFSGCLRPFVPIFGHHRQDQADDGGRVTLQRLDRHRFVQVLAHDLSHRTGKGRPARHVPAIAVAPSDPDAVVPAVRRAQRRGAKVITFDADSAPEGRSFFVNQATSDSIGRFGARLLVKAMGTKGKVAIVSARPTAANQNARITAFRDELKQYPDIQVVDEVYGYDNEQKAFDANRGVNDKVP
jgi:hypothetical protein